MRRRSEHAIGWNVIGPSARRSYTPGAGFGFRRRDEVFRATIGQVVRRGGERVWLELQFPPDERARFDAYRRALQPDVEFRLSGARLDRLPSG